MIKLYPLVKITILFIAGLVLAKYIPFLNKNAFEIGGISLALTLTFYLLGRNLPRRAIRYLFLFWLGLSIISAGIFRCSLASRLSSHDISRFISNDPVMITGTIRGDPVYQRHSIRFDLRCRQLMKANTIIPVTGLLQVVFHGQVKEIETIVRCGNRIRISSRITTPRERGNPGERSERTILAVRSIHTRSRIYRSGAITLVEEAKPWSLFCLALDLKHRLQEIIRSSLPGPHNHPGSIQSALLEALMLGERSAIPYEIKENFRAVGVIHVLVVSGLHVGFIWLLGNFIFSPLPLRRRHALIIPLVVGYVLITGASTATVRAGVMACAYSLAYVLNQPRKSATALATAALALLLYNPLNLFGAGFQLSFLIVLTMITLVPILDRWLRVLPGWLRPFVSVPLAAQLGALPLVAYYFHFISLSALPANFLVIPLVGLIVSLGFTSALFGLIAEPLAWLINYPNRYLILLLLKLVGWFSRLPGTALRVGSFPVLWIFIWYLILFGLAALRYLSRRRVLIVAGVVLLLLAGWGAHYLPRPPDPPLRAIFFNTRSGDPTLIRQAQGTTILISSDDDRFGDIPGIIGPYLFLNKIHHLDYLILTQANLDHLNVLNKLLEFATIGTVLDHPLGPVSPSYPRFREVLDENGISYRRLTADDLIETGKSSLSVLWPRCRAGTPFQPDHSLVVKLRFGEITFLFPSRIDIAAQEELAETLVDLRATVLKTPWRGSSAHISPFFLKAVNPEYGLLIQGQKYFGRHPRNCGTFLKRQGAEVHRTGREGGLIVETDGRSCRVISSLNRLPGEDDD
ncbi:MAG: ComEC/Rec2 family competence protein [Candidatus Euphemobacter frigidus]|nr:ComEC/Rec2 family competence protein [Candidatus Euphemobacter frigidus]MDP8276750.1 ComEC/Rec2 family competence protein [Candidatus Euphemobacter frigidus]